MIFPYGFSNNWKRNKMNIIGNLDIFFFYLIQCERTAILAIVIMSVSTFITTDILKLSYAYYGI
jgi:hypothetical protein